MGGIWLVRTCVLLLCCICVGSTAGCVVVAAMGREIPPDLAAVAITSATKVILVVLYLHRRKNGRP